MARPGDGGYPLILFNLSERRDFFLLAVFLFIMPLDAALSNLEIVYSNAFLASVIFLAANKL